MLRVAASLEELGCVLHFKLKGVQVNSLSTGRQTQLGTQEGDCQKELKDLKKILKDSIS